MGGQRNARPPLGVSRKMAGWTLELGQRVVVGTSLPDREIGAVLVSFPTCSSSRTITRNNRLSATGRIHMERQRYR